MNTGNLKAGTTSTTTPSPFLSGKMTQRFETIQHCLVPRSKAFSSEEKIRSQGLINTVLMNQDEASRKKLALFITVIDVLSLLLYLKLFKGLTPKQQTKLMNKFFDSPIPIFRKGFWGLNTLARLGVYGQKELHDEIGYRLRENI